MRIVLLLLIVVICVSAISCLKPKKKFIAGGFIIKKPKSSVGKLVKVVPKLLIAAGVAKVAGKLLLKKKKKEGDKIKFGKLKKFGKGKGKFGKFGKLKKLLRKKRTISAEEASVASRAVTDFVSNGLESTSRSLRSVGDQFHMGGDMLRRASLSTRIAGIMTSSRLRRSKRAAPRRNFQVPAGKMSLDEMLTFVRQHNAEVCLQRVICELSASSNVYGEDGIRFGSRLLSYQQVSNYDAEKYKRASKIGNQYRGNPKACSRKFPKSQCNYDSTQLIDVGNSILY